MLNRASRQRRRAFAIAVGLLTTDVAFTQEPLPNDVATLEVAAYVPRQPTEEMLKARKGKQRTEPALLTFEWTRPANVQYLLIAACGGGAGGGPSVRNYDGHGRYFNRAGFGGEAASFEKTWIGPLRAASYQITLGRGGLSGQDGANTEFRGADVTISFRGAPAATSRKENDRAQPGSSVHFAPGGGEPPVGGQVTGAGAGDIFIADVGSGGGASPLGAGGNGGAREESGKDSGGLCAGGGGAGKPAFESSTAGGQGGDGYLHIVPLIDMTVVAEQVERLIQSINKQQPPQAVK